MYIRYIKLENKFKVSKQIMQSLIPSTQDAGAEDPGALSAELRQDGINMIVIGIGKGTNQTELNHMAGGADNAFSAASFDELIGGDFIQTLTERSCVEGIKL